MIIRKKLLCTIYRTKYYNPKKKLIHSNAMIFCLISKQIMFRVIKIYKIHISNVKITQNIMFYFTSIEKKMSKSLFYNIF